jgi:hypothetical protein
MQVLAVGFHGLLANTWPESYLSLRKGKNFPGNLLVGRMALGKGIHDRVLDSIGEQMLGQNGCARDGSQGADELPA